MREIKFRAWDKEKKRMCTVQDMLYITHGLSSISVWDLASAKGEKDAPPLIWGDGKYSLRSPDFELMQFTGLYDKNGEPIYEGDVVVDLQNRKLEVMWNESYLQFQFNNEDLMFGFEDFESSKDLEIIGNIYKNPELLTKEGKK